MSAATDATLAVDPLTTGPTGAQLLVTTSPPSCRRSCFPASCLQELANPLVPALGLRLHQTTLLVVGCVFQATACLHPLSCLRAPCPAEPATSQPLQEHEAAEQPTDQPAPSTGKRERKSAQKEAPKKIYFCAKANCQHSFEHGVGRRPCYVQNGSFSKGAHKRSCGGGYRWLEVRAAAVSDDRAGACVACGCAETIRLTSSRPSFLNHSESC